MNGEEDAVSPKWEETKLKEKLKKEQEFDVLLDIAGQIAESNGLTEEILIAILNKKDNL